MTKPTVILEWRDFGSRYRLVRCTKFWSREIIYKVETKSADATGAVRWLDLETISRDKGWVGEEGKEARFNRLLITALVERDFRRSRRRKRKAKARAGR